ncbi:hypothetical protein [Prauserella cavernicola]|uniref:DUF2269 family protein n=1 Tax=Prauserella cavernicola TaxID=2800127 RepID=A0A934V543_9PSEU|nr:hypothetical protein [Prauserella cavernicola]MBK1786072.1 hypothetical protein [Prauserella cavernicola]
MSTLLLSLHVLAAILAVGPIAVAASLFPRYVRTPLPDGGEASTRAATAAAVLHRICRVYTAVGASVPVLGVATGAALGVLTDPWLIASVVLTALAAGLLAFAILPRQQDLLETPDTGQGARLAMITGMFNVLWAIVVVLMIVRPGSTTSA